jgi:glycosyltransferase involved in cell wall biosynthesis
MFKKGVVLLLLIFCSFIRAEDKRFAIIICGYKNIDWFKKNLDSVFVQTYKNWYIIYTDDNSPDDTGNAVKNYYQSQGMSDQFILIQNKTRKRALANIYHAIHLCDPRDVVVILDADDWLADKYVLEYLNAIYQDPNIWLTYGQFEEYPSGKKGWCLPMPAEAVEKQWFRYYTHIPSHLRTFYAALFHKIKREDLLYKNGDFFPMTYDFAIMLPMIEMARWWHFKFIDDILLIYNTANELNDHKVDEQLQRDIAALIRKKDRYEALQSLF